MINQIEEETGSLPPNLPRGVAPEVAAANSDVQAIIAPRLTMLMEIANSFLLTIMDSMESVPYGIRWICKQIRSLTRVRRICIIAVLYLLNTFYVEKISRGDRLCHMLSHWWLFLSSLHQPRDCYASGLYACRRRTSKASPTHLDFGMFIH